MPARKNNKAAIAALPASSAPDNAEPLGVALLGCGTVGGGVFDLLQQQADAIARKCGREIRIVSAAKRDLSKTAHLPPALVPLLVPRWQDAIAHPQAGIVVELMGGIDNAADAIRAALAAGKPVVTANKALLAEYSSRAAQDFLQTTSDANAAALSIEASIAGCIPIVKVLQDSLISDDIHRIYGIINGTCNYILSDMEARGTAFADALADAQRLGFAEEEPTLDIDGIDASHKLLLLSRLAFGASASMAELPVRGIRDFDAADIGYARQFNFRIKLLATAKRVDGNQIECRVCPTLIPLNHMLASIGGSNNAIVVQSHFAGETAYVGAGAGAQPTAVAVVADIINIARAAAAGAPYPHTHPLPHPNPPALRQQFDSPHYLRLRVVDQPGILAVVTDILAKHKISIEAIHQNISKPSHPVDVIIISHACSDALISASIAQIDAHRFIVSPTIHFPIEPLA